MPELPEVETVKNELTPFVVGRQVTDVVLFWDKILRKPGLKEFRNRLIGQHIEGLERRGKYLFFRLGSGEYLVLHLKMSGSLLLNNPDGRFVRAVLQFDGMKVYFRDPRKFGRIWLVAEMDELAKALGPEPLEDGFTAEVLAVRLRGRQAPIKAVFLDQKVVAGIGNMYADEILFAARIHPLRPAASLRREEIERIHAAIKQVLGAAIGNKGASVREYFRPGGELGTAHFEFKVAHQGGKVCPGCGSRVERITVRNRGTYYCPRCQPLEP
ncbi:MAG: bifunctional DNA-formamidopyrimidine glycosylase/DNA-(apurinic or apyrimidinic site) lyase [Chloroflexi bacterium]|nr:bifunctional DNA-formamidopyrimidine glycosylase/DNA-(apurinic or apyrimidinic site) lyase [Chloroflexota bacterium]